MDLGLLIREVRPTGDVVDFRSVRDISGAMIVHGDGEEAARWFKENASALDHGSVFVLLGGDTMLVGDVDAAVRMANFHAWHRGPDYPGLPPGAQTWVKHEGGGYGSHLVVLREAVLRTEGPVLELGGGESSTGELHEIVARRGRRLVTVESDFEWAGRLRDRYGYFDNVSHEVVCEPDPSQSYFLDEKWSVVFVDHAPGETRRRAIERVRDQADIIVVHDTEELGYGLEPVISSFRYRRDHRRCRPWTTVVSDFREVW